MKKPIVAIIGRPNVGKSTLFNRIIGKRLAIVDDTPGVTRDRNAVEYVWNRRTFILVDTGGFVASSKDRMEAAVSEQSALAIEEADVLLLLVDANSGITDYDNAIRKEILKSGKPVVLGVNKIDNSRKQYDIYEFYNLGLGEPYPISGLTGRGSGDLLDAVVGHFPADEGEYDEEEQALRIALIGRPNVGKSSMVNALTGRTSVLVTDIPGTTRDSIDTHITYNDRSIVLVDTAGLKRVTRLKESLEYYSYLRTQTSLSRCDVAAVVIDIDEGLTSYEKNLVDEVVEQGKGLMIIANKWDLIEKDTMTMKNTETSLRDELPDKESYPILFTSALTGKRAPNILDTAIEIDNARKLRIRTSEFNDFIQKLPVPPGAGDVSVLYGTQHGTEPPSFVLFVNDVRKVKDNFKRYTERAIREHYGFWGTPVRLSFKSKKKKRN